MKKIAVIGIGSNSVRMLLTVEDGRKGKRLFRDREGTRLFAGLDEKGNLSVDSMNHTAQAVARMAAYARNEGAETVRLFATSATRDAANQTAFAQLLREQANVELEICSGLDEAAYSYIGASDGTACGVIDIGGGSTEVITGQGMDVEYSFSAQMGAVRLFRMLPLTNEEEMNAVIAHAEKLLRERPETEIIAGKQLRFFGTGGTFTTLASMVRGTHWTERAYMHGTRVTREQVLRQAELLCPMSLEERRQLPGLQPNRADIIVHGICILIACMNVMNIGEITVSEYGNLDGFTKKEFGLTEGLY